MTECVSKCLNCQRIKAEHQRPGGLLRPLKKASMDALRACALDFKGKWVEHLPSVELRYNNSYHSSTGMPLYEDLHGRKCRTFLCWSDMCKIGTENGRIYSNHKEKIKVAQDRQKQYADKRRKDRNCSQKEKR